MILKSEIIQQIQQKPISYEDVIKKYEGTYFVGCAIEYVKINDRIFRGKLFYAFGAEIDYWEFAEEDMKMYIGGIITLIPLHRNVIMLPDESYDYAYLKLKYGK